MFSLATIAYALLSVQLLATSTPASARFATSVGHPAPSPFLHRYQRSLSQSSPLATSSATGTSQDPHSFTPNSLSTSSNATSSSPSLTLSSGSPTGSSTSSATASSLSTSSVSSTTPSTTAPAQTADPSTVANINTVHVRRLPFIIASATKASSISAWLSTLGPDGKWPDSEIDYTTGCAAQRANWPAQVHWQRIVTMSSAFHGGLKGASTGQWVNNAQLRAATTLAMDFWFSNDFTNIGCLDSGGNAACPCGTPGFWNTNWFSNIIGIPKLVIQSCLVLNDTLTPTQLSNCTNFASRAYATFGHNINGVGMLTGANTLDVASEGIDLGLLTVNASLVSDAYGRIHNEVVIEQAIRADGIRPDGSFGQHGGIIYNGNYGKDYANDVLALEIPAAGTQFEANSASKQAFASLVDADQWMIYQNVLTGVLHWDFSVLGRFISFPVADNQATASIKINITQFLVLGENWDSQVLIDASNNLAKNTSNANVGSLVGNRVFYDNDYMVSRGPGYVTTLRMYSNRTTNTECTNSQSPFGFHLSDGTVYTYLNGSEYEDIAAAWDWNLIPGTTVDYAATPLTCGTTQQKGVEGFVGGASNGNVGVGAMRYTNPQTKSLSWQKAWFFLGGNVQHVMVNSIRSTTNAPVFSVLDQRKHVSDIIVDGKPAASGNFSGAHALWHGNVGYTFPRSLSNVSLTVDVGERTGDWSALGISTQPPPTIDLFAAWLAHSGSDAAPYTAFPATDYQTFVSKASQTNIEELVNTGNVSAVLDRAHNTAMAVFWTANGGTVVIPPVQPSGAPIALSSNAGLLVVLDEKAWKITVSDPSQSLKNARVTLRLGPGMAPAGWGNARTKSASVALPTGGIAGSSVTVPLNDAYDVALVMP